jgi:hypothetical protein
MQERSEGCTSLLFHRHHVTHECVREKVVAAVPNKRRHGFETTIHSVQVL